MNRLRSFGKLCLLAAKKAVDPRWRAKQMYARFYKRLPVNGSLILLESEHGRKINGNIFYLIRYLSQSDIAERFRIYVSCTKDSKQGIADMLAVHGIRNVRLCVYGSAGYYRILASAGYLINDTSFGYAFIKKEGQIYLNTWHGTPLKAMGRSTEKEKHLLGNIQRNFLFCDYILTPNEQTYRSLFRDYMIEGLAPAKAVYAGYPRNVVFFDAQLQADVRRSIDPHGRKLYAYMPTFRGLPEEGGTDGNDECLAGILHALDEGLSEDELLLVNLHPLARKAVSFDGFARIREFPRDYETYEVLSACDCLITDYSSVFFDFAVTRRKIVLFPYDYEAYLKDRGTYMPMESLPFPRVYSVGQLFAELRSPKRYEDEAFLRTYCAYESASAAARLCEFVINGTDGGFRVKDPETNGRRNILIFGGNLDKNGITSSLKNLMNAVDSCADNYILTFREGASGNQNAFLADLPETVRYVPMVGSMLTNVTERVLRALFRRGMLSAARYASWNGRCLCREKLRCFGGTRIDTAVHFSGYEKEMIVLFSLLNANRVIYVHSDMQAEIRMKGNQRSDVLSYAYAHYDTVAVVTEDLIPSMGSFTGSERNIRISRNLIDSETIRRKAADEIALDENTDVFPDREAFFDAMASSKTKFITVGRFSPEKGHKRLISAFRRYHAEHGNCCLIIMGGYSVGNGYEETADWIRTNGMEDSVILLHRVSNPYPVIRSCDGFILSSFYEGFGLVIAEADILGIPVVATDIAGPRTFMREHGGTMVESSEEGIYEGLCLLGAKQVPTMSVDYKTYNRDAIREFEALIR